MRGIRFGRRKPKAADSTVISASAASAPTKMTYRECFIAMIAAIKNVLSLAIAEDVSAACLQC